MDSLAKTLTSHAARGPWGRVFSALRANSHGLVSRDSLRASATFAMTRIPAFLLPVVIAGTFGIGANTDRFFLALAIATFALNSIAGAAETVAVPFLAARHRHGGGGKALLHRMLIGVVLGAAFLLLLAFGAVRVLRPASPTAADDLEVAGYLLALAPYVILGSIASLASGALCASRRYVLATSSHGLRPLVAITLVVALGPRIGIIALAIGFGIGTFLQVTVLVRPLQRAYGSEPVPRSGESDVGTFYGQATWQVLGSLLAGLTPLVDRFMVSQLETGSVSILEYADRLWAIPVNLLASGVLIVCLTEWSRLHADPSQREVLYRTVSGAARTVVMVMTPIAVLFILLRHDLVATILGWGAFPSASIPTAANTAAVLFAGMPLYVVSLLYARALVVTRRTQWLLLVAAIQVGAKIAGNLLLLPLWGVVGAAASTTFVYALACPLLMLAFYRSGRGPHRPLQPTGAPR